MTPTTGAEDRAAERAIEAATARERQMAEAIDALCREFDPASPTGETVTSATHAAWAQLKDLSEALFFGPAPTVALPPSLSRIRPMPTDAPSLNRRVTFDPCTASAPELYAYYTVEDRSPAEDFAALRDDLLALGRGSPSARVAAGWSVEPCWHVVVLEDGTYLTYAANESGRMAWVEGPPVPRTFRAATQGR